MIHGVPSYPFPLDVWLGDDPDVALVVADMDVWADAHPCDCEALCECEETRGTHSPDKTV